MPKITQRKAGVTVIMAENLKNPLIIPIIILAKIAI